MRQIRLGYNNVPASAKKAVLEVLESGQFSPGNKVREFEEKFAKLHHAEHAVFVNSGTDALRLSLLAMKEKYHWHDGDLVAVPALTFVATVNVILQAGLKPFFVDVSMNDYLINPWNLEHRLMTASVPMYEVTGRSKEHGVLVAVIPVHLFGQSCQDYIYTVAKKYGLKVLEDSCETILNPVRGVVSCHSTYMAHHLTTGVGGFAVTDDADLSLIIRSLANHGRDFCYIPGFSKPARLEKQLLKHRFSFDRIGYSCRGTEFEAALGLAQLDKLYDNVMHRQVAASLLSKLLERYTELKLPTWQPGRSNTAMMFPIVLKNDAAIDKYDLCLHLEKNGIETRDLMPITNQPCYKHLIREDDFSVAKELNKNGFYIPIHPNMTEDDVGWIATVFGKYLDKKAKIPRTLDKIQLIR